MFTRCLCVCACSREIMSMSADPCQSWRSFDFLERDTLPMVFFFHSSVCFHEKQNIRHYTRTRQSEVSLKARKNAFLFCNAGHVTFIFL